eukprot:Hpha_TRINITY_DN16370_c4_g1::TRINITY_DN16370_c4_g1_i2::g.62432::m.62432
MSVFSGSAGAGLLGDYGAHSQQRPSTGYEEDSWRPYGAAGGYRRASSPFEEAVGDIEAFRFQGLTQDDGMSADHSAPGLEDVRELHRDLFVTELLRKQGEARETIRVHLSREAEMRVRLCKLANADLFTVRFIEEARWELRERKEVIERREALERSRLRSQLVDLFVDYLVVGGGSWSEDSARAGIMKEEEREWRALDDTATRWMKLREEEVWDDHLAEEDHIRTLEAERRVVRSEEVQKEEHRRRFHLTAELYPAALNRLMHVMELEWVELSGALVERYTHILSEHRVFLISDEELQRRRIRRRCRRVLQDFILLHRLLYLQHAEEFERQVTMENVDRMFSVLFSRETVQIKALLERTRLLNESVAAALKEKGGATNSFSRDGGGTGSYYPAQGYSAPDLVIDDAGSTSPFDTAGGRAHSTTEHLGRFESQSPGRLEDVVAAANALLQGSSGEEPRVSTRRLRGRDDSPQLTTPATASRRELGKDWLGLRLGAYASRRSSGAPTLTRTLTPPASPS